MPHDTDSDDLFLFAFVISIILFGGIVLSSVVTNRIWEDWAIEQGYAKHNSKTGKIVYLDKK